MSETAMMHDPQQDYDLKKVLGRGSFGAVYYAIRFAFVFVVCSRTFVDFAFCRRQTSFTPLSVLLVALAQERGWSRMRS
jgi:hypothetical protein